MSTPQPATAGWVAPPHKLAAGQTVNLSAVSASLAGAAAAAPVDGYSTVSSPSYARASSSSSGRSSPYISRTASGSSVEVPAGGAAGELAAAALQALSRQGSLGGGSGTGSSPHRAGTPRPAVGRSNLGRDAESAAATDGQGSAQGVPISFHAPNSGDVPSQPPVEVFARFPQSAGPSGRQHYAGRNGVGRNGGGSFYAHRSDGTSQGQSAYAPPVGPLHHAGAFFVGSPPGGYGMPPPGMYGGLPGTSGMGVPHGGAYGPGAAYYPPQAQQGGYVMHPYYGLVPAGPPGPHPAAYAAPPGAHQAGGYGVPYPHPAGMAGGRSGPGAGHAKDGVTAAAAGSYEAAEYARQYQAMVSYMQGFGMMVSPSSSPERHLSRPPTFRRNGGAGGSQDGRPRVAGRPSRLSLDMSVSKSENGDAHRLDPELAPLVAEDRAELQSELLEEFKAGREGRQWALQDLKGHLYPFCRDQHGSRLVQQQLEGADPEAVAELFGEVRHKLLPLMVDVFGNYVVQRFLERGGQEVQAAVAEELRGRALPLSLQMYGCRVVQKALEVLPQADRVAIASELTEHALRCVRDQNGNHVIQKCIECVQPSDPARAMIETIVSQGQALSTHTFGCRLVQRVLEFCSIAELRDQVISDVLRTALQLSHDQYGNYVVQHLVTKGPEPAREAIVAKVAPQVMTLAQHKYASNVVEACLKHGRPAHRDAIIEQVIREAGARPAALAVLGRDQFGNYVVQRCLEVATPPQKTALLEALQPNLDQLRKYTYGKHIVNKVEAMLAAQAAASDGKAVPSVPLPTPLPLAAAPAGPE